jgi:polyferredoxin
MATQTSQSRECPLFLSGPAMSQTLADRLCFAFRHLLLVGQLQLWRLRLRDLINFCEEANVRRIAWSSTPRFLF